MPPAIALFRIGQVVHHRLYDYRGVIVDADPSFRLTEAWYEANAKSSPPKDKPWYYVLVHGTVHRTYVPEVNLEPDMAGDPINHPDLNQFFDEQCDDGYVSRRRGN
ncbi:MAG: heat shock protein HspQ [Alphaproteobacteria bacterium]